MGRNNKFFSLIFRFFFNLCDGHRREGRTTLSLRHCVKTAEGIILPRTVRIKSELAYLTKMEMSN